jgi:hypothetical protein
MVAHDRPVVQVLEIIAVALLKIAIGQAERVTELVGERRVVGSRIEDRVDDARLELDRVVGEMLRGPVAGERDGDRLDALGREVEAGVGFSLAERAVR